MELREPIKKRAPFKKYPAPPLPVVTGESAGHLLNTATEVLYVGYYNGQSVVITQPEEINALYSMVCVFLRNVISTLKVNKRLFFFSGFLW
jgi:hypothetical protein